MDLEFRESHMPILERFYLLFENVYKYVKDFVKFLEDLEHGVIFIQQTFEVYLHIFFNTIFVEYSCKSRWQAAPG